MSRGRFITIEGVEASGKSTQGRLLAEQTRGMVAEGLGATPAGNAIRGVLFSEDLNLSLRARFPLLVAAHIQFLDEVVAPTLEEGRDVIADGYYSSIFAAAKVDPNSSSYWIEKHEAQVSRAGLYPEHIIILGGVRLEELQARGKDGSLLETVCVANGLGALSRLYPNEVAAVNGVGTPGEVAVRVQEAIGAQ